MYRFLCYSLAVSTILFTHSLHAQELSLSEVLSRLEQTFPLILALEQEIDQAEGRSREALGAFDLNWKTTGNIVSEGYYETQRFKSVLEKPLEFMGSRLYGGYRQGGGDFAVYDGKLETTPGGELHAGFNLPLLRDRAIDNRRARLKEAALGIDLASHAVEVKRIEIYNKARQAYWKWLAAGLRVQIAEDLLATAKKRGVGLQERVAQGDLPEFEFKDNKRTILKRDEELIKTLRQFQEASLMLSLYYRTTDADPIVATRKQLPKEIRRVPVPQSSTPLIQEALSRRPELGVLENVEGQVEIDSQYQENQLMPKLDFIMEISKDLGGGDDTREPTELESGFLLEVPLQRRVAEGKIIQNQAKLGKIARDRQLIKDRIAIQVADALSELTNANSRIDIIKSELGFARELEEGERERFRAGESTILIVNLREIATAVTAAKEVDALRDYRIAEANLIAAIGRDVEQDAENQ